MKERNIIPVSFSDHSALSFNIQSDDFIKRGPGFFKFNNSLLDDQCFVEDLREKIPEYKQKYDYLENKSLYWDMLKMEIRSFTIYYCKRNAKTKKAEEVLLQEKLSSLHKLMYEKPTQETIANYYEVKMKLERISLHKTEGAMIRSKSRWCEQGERSTRYFFNLEKRNHSNKYITKLRVENGTLTASDEILNEEHRYYKRLYTSSRTNPHDPRFDVFFDCSTLPKLSPHQADSCDGLLTKEESYASLKTFPKGKSPGTDGLTAEFYLSFWELLGQELVDSFNYTFEKGEMSISQKRGIVTLIPKKDKNRTLLDNWRPISLLNTDYKVATKSIAARIAKVLPGLIHEDQTGYIKGRFIGQNIRLIAGIKECTKTLDNPGIALFLDFKKVFDSLEWNFIKKALETFNFGAPLIQWFNTFYSNIQSCVINNGYATSFFELERGVLQGCPLSAVLFVIGVEIFANSIRNDKLISGINFKGREYKLSQYADDTSCLVRDVKSVEKLFEKLDAFRECCGLELNRSKTEALWLGKTRPQSTNLFNINWPKKCVCLGVSFSCDSEASTKDNFEKKFVALEKCLDVWSSRDSTLFGKITIVKSLALSKIIFISYVLGVPTGFVDQVHKSLSNFIWNDKPPKIKRSTMIGRIKDGGLSMPDFDIIDKSLKAGWVKRLLDVPSSAILEDNTV